MQKHAAAAAYSDQSAFYAACAVAAKSRSIRTECVWIVAAGSNFFLDFIYPKSLIVGSRICHQIDSRSFHFGLRKFPLCARCTAMYLSFFMGVIIRIFVTLPLYISVILIVPMLIDGFTQLYTKYESNNTKRVITGALFGYAMSTMIFIFCKI